jgi:hypothetical protein
MLASIEIDARSPWNEALGHIAPIHETVPFTRSTSGLPRQDDFEVVFVSF